MKRNVTEHDFTEAFRDYGRQDNFSYEGLKALYEWFEEYEEDAGEEIELDVIGICCDFSEYLGVKEILDLLREYDNDWYPLIYDEDDEERPQDEIDEELIDYAVEWFQDRTQVIEFGGVLGFRGEVSPRGIIIQGF